MVKRNYRWCQMLVMIVWMLSGISHLIFTLKGYISGPYFPLTIEGSLMALVFSPENEDVSIAVLVGVLTVVSVIWIGTGTSFLYSNRKEIAWLLSLVILGVDAASLLMIFIIGVFGGLTAWFLFISAVIDLVLIWLICLGRYHYKKEKFNT